LGDQPGVMESKLGRVITVNIREAKIRKRLGPVFKVGVFKTFGLGGRVLEAKSGRGHGGEKGGGRRGRESRSRYDVSGRKDNETFLVSSGHAGGRRHVE